ncbi:FecCD family ABC transporter permease [Bacillus horti]|uniref:Iron complex transport system permease protein n=1 Tax=Caldalkalibacillus horti TaxID=77523 RepID=A0ABT9VWP7_9BACI|nr:iron ABC transporter permease [Bacillus horti]MDQ0165030.1 iron complex transport system permease protein [Bacillus horti]
MSTPFRRYRTVRAKSNWFSFHIEKRPIWLMLGLLVGTLLLFVLALSVGSTWISPKLVLQTLLGQSSEFTFIIETLRLPRAIVALAAGAALGVSGAILQGVVRNPLASPGIIGITGGAGVAAVAFLVYFNASISIRFLPLSAVLGAALVALLIYVLAWKKGVSPIRLVLIGVGIQACMQALTIMMIMFSPMHLAGQAYIWLTGSVYGADWLDVSLLLPWIIIFIPLAWMSTRHLNLQELGDDTTTGLGSKLQLQRCILLAISVVLAGAAVSVAGTIGFVGLLAPHIARRLAGRSYGYVIPTAAFIGGLIVLAADIVGRTIYMPHDIPAGVFISGIGAPFFMYLLLKNKF